MKAVILAEKMTKKTNHQNEYIIKPKSSEIVELRKLFGKAKKLQKTKAENLYEQRKLKSNLLNGPNNGTIKDLLKFHWFYDYKI